MSVIDQDAIGACDFLDVLEEAQRFATPVKVVLRAGESFEDVVVDVVTEAGKNFVVFRSRGRVHVADIANSTRAVPRRKDR